MVWDAAGSGNVHIDVALTNVSIGWPNTGYVGEALFPSIPVAKQSNLYYIFGREVWALDPGGDLRAPGSIANEIPGMKVSTNPYYAKEHALQIPVTDEERENSDNPFNPDRDGTELVTMKVNLGREVAMKNLVQTAANYPSAGTTTLSGTAQFNDYVNSDPIKVIKDGIRQIIRQIYVKPNTAIIPWEVMTQLEDHPDFIERIKYSERGILTEEIIASILGLEKVIVPGVAIDSANPGQSSSLGFLWGKDIVLTYVPPRAGQKIPAFGYEFNWTFGGTTQIVDRWREEPRASDLIRARRRYDLQLTALDGAGKSIAGYLIKAAVA